MLDIKIIRENPEKINELLKPKIGNASNEIFALFMANIYEKIPGCILGQFSKMKFVNGSNFKKFKDYFLADYVSGFIVPGDTFDNVKGKFPIAGGKGLFSAIEGIGMLLLVATGLSGLIWFLFQGTATAIEWRGYHQLFAQAFIGFLVVHLLLAISHIIDFIRQ